jgi:hypothetical protein
MPRKGYKCITINEEIHESIKKRARETNRTMCEYVEYLLDKEKTNKAGNNPKKLFLADR